MGIKRNEKTGLYSAYHNFTINGKKYRLEKRNVSEKQALEFYTNFKIKEKELRDIEVVNKNLKEKYEDLNQTRLNELIIMFLKSERSNVSNNTTNERLNILNRIILGRSENEKKTRADNKIKLAPGNTKVCDLTKEDFQDWKYKLRNTKKNDRRKNIELSLVRKMFEYASEENMIKESVYKRILREKINSGMVENKKMNLAIKKDEVIKLRDELRKGDEFDNLVADLIITMFYTGARISEIIAVKKKDLNSVNNTLYIGKTLNYGNESKLDRFDENNRLKKDYVQGKGKQQIKNTKNKKDRLLDISGIKVVLERNVINKSNDNYIFERNGKPLAKTSIMNRIIKALEKTDIDENRKEGLKGFHVYRRGFTTALAEVAVDDNDIKQIEIKLGHAPGMSKTLRKSYDKVDLRNNMDDKLKEIAEDLVG